MSEPEGALPLPSPRVCENCGRLTAADSPLCAYCGMPSRAALAEEIERRDERRFAEVIFGRKSPATWVFFGLNVALFLALGLAANTIDPDQESYQTQLFNFGAAFSPLIAKGEYWRLVMPMFLHVGVFHLAANSYALYQVGPQVEKLYGTARFVVIYLATAIGGVGAGYLFGSPDRVSAGASCSLFGLFGVLFVFGYRHRADLPGVFRSAFGARVLPLILINLMITIAVPNIDAYGHVGGLVTGMALAAVMSFAQPGERSAPVAWKAAAAVCALVMLGSGAAVALAPPRSARDIARIEGEVVTSPTGVFVREANATRAALSDAEKALVLAANGQPVPPFDANATRLAAARARGARGLDDATSRLFAREGDLLDRAAGMLEARGADGSVAEAPAEAWLKDKKALDDDWAAWIRDHGVAFGIRQDDSDDGDSDAP